MRSPPPPSPCPTHLVSSPSHPPLTLIPITKQGKLGGMISCQHLSCGSMESKSDIRQSGYKRNMLLKNSVSLYSSLSCQSHHHDIMSAKIATLICVTILIFAASICEVKGGKKGGHKIIVSSTGSKRHGCSCHSRVHQVPIPIPVPVPVHMP